MKKIFYLILVLIFILLFLKACIRQDIAEDNVKNVQTQSSEQNVNFPKNPINIDIFGVEYLQSQAPVGKFGGELVESIIGNGPKTFNPFTYTDATSSTMVGLMYDGLFSNSPKDGSIIPKLAKSYTVSNDGKKYIINLRKGALWSDGVEITADDVIFTWNKIILAGLGNTSTRDSVLINGKLPKITKLDKYTVKFEISEKFAPFLRIIGTQIIAPKHAFEEVVKLGGKDFELFYSTNTNPNLFVTSGPYKLKEYKAAQRIVFERNPNYYVVNSLNQNLPYLDKIVFLIVGDLNNEILKFEANEIDMISLNGSNVAPYKIKEDKSNYKIYNLGPSSGTMFIAFNLNSRKNKDNEYNVKIEKQRWFRDKNFRTAIDYALDRKSLIQNIANGLADPLFTPESLNSIFLNKSIKGHDKNLAKAKKILSDNGYILDKNNLLHDKYDNLIEFDLYTNAGNTEREAIGVMVKQDLEDLGMKINYKPIEFNTLVNKMTTTYDWDMIIMGLTGSILEPHNGKNVWASNGSLHLFNQRNGQTKTDDRLPFEKRLDEIFEQAALKNTFAERKKLYDEYQAIIYNEKPMIYLYSPLSIVAIRKKFKNLKYVPT